MNKTRVLVSTSTNPWFNLAVEEVIYLKMNPFHRVLFIWRNADTVVIGRAQNPWRECNTERIQQDGITLARRKTGGGAVFHDLGNTNFTFMAGKPEYNKSVSTQIVIDALKTFNIDAEANGRNDLVIKDGDILKKFSGSAYREAKDRGFHHGTLLINADLSRLENYLTPNPKKLAAKGITSIKSRVTNLNLVNPRITHQGVSDALILAYLEYYNEDKNPNIEIEYISPKSLSTLPNLEQTFSEYSQWNWNFGKTPQFTHAMDERFSWGGIEVYLNITNGIIEEANLYTDSLDPTPFESLSELLVGVHYDKDSINTLIDNLLTENQDSQDQINEFQIWFIGEIE
ncbi:lipoate--protein ligase [Psychromonas aquatilis]|uniref:lipoate--protein ligase n=1 Tax=Psychromonas aquatilis TaxID=2005072 RepID=A0ABU9GN97_9GAMM